MNTVTDMPQIELAKQVATWIQERYRTDRMRDGLRKLLASLDEARSALDQARTAYREAEAEVERIDATLSLSVTTNTELKNAEARKAALDVARTSDAERVAASAALERALVDRNRAATHVEELEALVKATHLVMGLATAEIQAVAALVQLPPF